MEKELYQGIEENNSFENEKFKLAFQIGQNIRYNHKRSAFFKRWANINKILTYIMGSANIVAVLEQQYGQITVCLNVLVLFLGAADSFIDFGNKARDYSDGYQAYKKLEMRLKMAKSLEHLTQIEIDMAEIELNEPNTLNVLMNICWNEEAAYQGCSSQELLQIGWFQHLVAQYIDLCPIKITKDTEKYKRKLRKKGIVLGK